jgi:prevent-host-death family protein
VAFEIALAPEAIEDLRLLKANARARVRAALERHLRHKPRKTSRSRIKRLRGTARPQHRLRVAEVRVFYDVSGSTVENLGDRPQIGGSPMADAIRKSPMRQVRVSELKGDLSRFLREAEEHEIVITRNGKLAGVLIGFRSEDDWFEYRLENDPRFLQRVERARSSLRAGRAVKIEDVDETA